MSQVIGSITQRYGVIKDYSYWYGMTQKETVLHILEQFFKDNPANQRPAGLEEEEDARRIWYKIKIG